MLFSFESLQVCIKAFFIIFFYIGILTTMLQNDNGNVDSTRIDIYRQCKNCKNQIRGECVLSMFSSEIICVN